MCSMKLMYCRCICSEKLKLEIMPLSLKIKKVSQLKVSEVSREARNSQTRGQREHKFFI